jgi:hypothetical protein
MALVACADSLSVQSIIGRFVARLALIAHFDLQHEMIETTLLAIALYTRVVAVAIDTINSDQFLMKWWSSKWLGYGLTAGRQTTYFGNFVTADAMIGRYPGEWRMARKAIALNLGVGGN